MLTHNGFALYKDHWVAPLAMVFGSFIGGATSEGGGAVAFPVLTLILKLPPAIARNFSFAIQSIGMTAASLLIISLKIPVDWRAIRTVTLSGIPGLFLSAYFVVPLISGPVTKIFFVSLWLSFAFALYLANRHKRRAVHNGLQPLSRADTVRILLFSFVGGIITAIFGDGINIFTFCLFTLYFSISEKVATPTSVIIMTIHTIVGFFLHVFILRDFQQETFHYWLCALPVAILMAPLGAFIINFLTRQAIANFLYFTSVVQYLGALIVVRPPWSILLLSISTIVFGFSFFWWLSKQKPVLSYQESYFTN